ncbi:MAG: hypothetical protein OEM76_10455 [Gammaproteobacteria bacterium]|nr:hypothetical protein [Gammaproteobacteria bacterium]
MANIAEIVGVIIVVGGLSFAVLQLRQFRQQQRELAAIELFRFYGNSQFTEAFNRVMHMTEGSRPKPATLLDTSFATLSGRRRL